MKNTKGTTICSVSASKAKSRFGSLLAWVAKNKSEVIIRVYGKPKVVIMAHTKYKEVQELREHVRRRQILKDFEQVRRKVSARFADIPEEERYRMAGMSESVIQDLIEEDEKLARKRK